HELKTPIATIRAVGETLVSGRVTNGDTLRDYAQLVVQEAKRLTRLVDNLLAYARITDVTEAYSFEPVDLIALVDQGRQEFRAQLQGGGFELRIEMPVDLPLVHADRTALELLLDNLVDNAIRYSGEGRLIQILARRDGSHVVIEVSDRGIGIPEDEIRQVMRRFVRGRRAGSGGSGLGLAIANRIVEDHHGLLAIRSAVGVGTTVSISLPAERNDDEDAYSRR